MPEERIKALRIDWLDPKHGTYEKRGSKILNEAVSSTLDPLQRNSRAGNQSANLDTFFFVSHVERCDVITKFSACVFKHHSLIDLLPTGIEPAEPVLDK